MAIATYAGMFWVALLAATIFPAQSEVLLSGFISSGRYSIPLLIAVATAGNVMGAIINWFIGINLARLEHYHWFPIQRASMKRAEAWYQHYGKWTLLLSWVPFIGDPLTVVAGILRERFVIFFLLVLIAKFTRYIIVAAIALRFL